MIGKKMQAAINEQIKEELGSAHLYLSMAAYFHSKGFDGMGHWMRCQTQEEMMHAMKLYDHLVERDGRVELLGLDQPRTAWKSPLEAFQEAYEHEQHITGRINDLVSIAAKENDNASAAMLQWFVTEQVEEEASTSKVAQDLAIVGDSGHGLLMLDRELAARLPLVTLPTAEGGTA
ncbi:ferritin [Candidatus Poribacteria bacterium]